MEKYSRVRTVKHLMLFKAYNTESKRVEDCVLMIWRFRGVILCITFYPKAQDE